MPWVVLAAALALTVAAVGLRERSVSDDRDDALAAAEGHFRDVVADNEHRGRVVAQAYERALVGSVRGLSSPVSRSGVAEGLDVLAADELVGAFAFIVMPAGAEPNWIGDGDSVPVVRRAAGESGLWVSAARGDDEYVLLGHTTAEGDVVAAVVERRRLLDSSTTADDHSHGVSVSLTALSLSQDAPLELDIDTSHMLDLASDGDGQAHGANHSDMSDPSPGAESADAAGEVVTDDPGGHTDVSHLHQGPVAFEANSEVVIFGRPWEISVTAGEEFLTIPSSREVAVLAGLGVLLSISLFVLIHFLVRRLAAEEQAGAAAERFAVAFNSSPIGAVVLDTKGRVVEANSALERLLDRSIGDLKDRSLVEFVAEPLRSEWTARIQRSADSPELRARAEVRYEPSPDRSLWVDETATPIAGKDGERHVLLQISDVTDQRRAREELQRRSLHDELTGLPNRTLLEDRLGHTLLRIRRDESIAAVMFMDVDQFKKTNDTLGHGAGDRLLTELARRLEEVTRDHDTIARFGGDEFVMLCENLPSPNEAWQIADRIRSHVSAPFELDGRPIAITVSIGIALCGSDDETEAVLRDADLAMYRAKELGRNRAILFEGGMRDNLIEQLEIEDELIRAIDDDQFELYYQPLIITGNGQLKGFEALIRWNHPDQGVLAPDAFLPAASQLGLLPSIDAWALAAAATQLVAWTHLIPEASDWTMAVNTSPVNFGDLGFADRVAETVLAVGADPSRLTIEITEDAIVANTDTAVEIIKQLREDGFRIAIDDFGTGYSSLSQLASLEIDVLKIDKSFIADLHNSPSNEIVRAVIDMADALGIPTVAEGVETQRDLDALKQLGATQAQGYLISRPVPAIQAQALASHTTAAAT